MRAGEQKVDDFCQGCCEVLLLGVFADNNSSCQRSCACSKRRETTLSDALRHQFAFESVTVVSTAHTAKHAELAANERSRSNVAALLAFARRLCERTLVLNEIIKRRKKRELVLKN